MSKLFQKIKGVAGIWVKLWLMVIISLFLLLVGVGVGWLIWSNSDCNCSDLRDEIAAYESKLKQAEALVVKAKEKIKECDKKTTEEKENSLACPPIKVQAGKGLRIVRCEPPEMCE